MNGDPIDAILQGERAPSPKAIQQPQDELDKAISGPAAPTEEDPLDVALKGTGHVTPPSAAHRFVDFLVHGLIVEPLKQVSSAIAWTLTGRNPGSQIPVTQGEVGDVATTMARSRQGAEAPSDDVMRGTALIASFAGGPAVEAAMPAVAGPVTAAASKFIQPGPLLGKWGSFLTGEFLGGSIYGAIAPTEEDESRSEAILGSGATFAAFGGIIKGGSELTSWALKRYILRLPEAKKKEVLSAVKTGLDKIESDLANGGVSLDQLPPEAAAKLEEPILSQAVQDNDPAAINIDEIVRGEADKEMEIAPRFEKQPGPELRLEQPPEVKFKEELTKAKFKPGETLFAPGTVPVMKKAIAAAGGRTELAKLVKSKAEASGRKIDGTFIEEVARNLVQETESRAQLKEHIVAPTVKGKSGKLYVGGSTHPETMDIAMKSGVPKEEFEVPDENRGFKTNLRDFTSREEAAGLVGHGEPLISEDAHKRGLLPFESEPVSELNLENTANQVSETTPQEVLMDAAVDHAVASISPESTMPLIVKQDRALVQEIHKLPTKTAKQHEHLREVLNAALSREGPAADKDVLLHLTEPAPEDVLAEKAKAGTPHEQNRERAKVKKGRKKAPVEVEPTEQVTADGPTTAEAIVPKELDGPQIAVRLNDQELNTLSQSMIDLAKNQSGRISARLLIGITGSAMEWLSFGDMPDAPKSTLRTVGGLLIAASIGPRVAELSKKYIRGFLTAYNPELMMNAYPKGKEFFRQYMEMLSEWKALAHNHARVLDDVFKDDAANRAAMFVLDEGQSAPEWLSLTQSQQREAMAAHQMNLRMGIIAKNLGVLEDFQENYVRHLLPPETFQKWKTTGYKVLPTSGAFAKQRVFSLRELENWAQKNAVPGPIMKLSTVHAYHLGEWSRAVAGTQLKNALERVSLVVDKPKSSYVALPDGWRPVSVLNMSDKIAPDPIARALESISSPRSSKNELTNALDAVKTLWMKSIMFFFWEHGFNAMRSVINLASNPRDYPRIYDFMRSTDGLDMQAARHGLNLYDRPEYGEHAHDIFQHLVRSIGITPGTFSGRVDKLLNMQDRLLWDKMIPFLQKFTYATEMYKFTNHTGGKFLEGSPEFTTAARRAADFANTVAGRVPRDLRDPELSRGMRLLLFSPQWTMSRISIMANAAGELGQIMSGEINARDAMYLPFKMRQLAWGIGITYLGSKILSGKAPTFNDKNSKFYMRTGMRNADGKEIGLDVIGWWQDDIRLFNKPLDFVQNRLNPAIRIAQETISGRDYLGRAMTPGQRVGNLVTSLGPIPEAASDLLRIGQAISGGRPISSGEALQMASKATATFRTAVIPRPVDVAVSRFAKKLLVKQGIPANDDNIFELSRLLRANLLQGSDLIDNRVITYLSYRRRSEVHKHPAKTELEQLWQEGRRVLADF